jgi:hypothetical protein
LIGGDFVDSNKSCEAFEITPNGRPNPRNERLREEGRRSPGIHKAIVRWSGVSDTTSATFWPFDKQKSVFKGGLLM